MERETYFKNLASVIDKTLVSEKEKLVPLSDGFQKAISMILLNGQSEKRKLMVVGNGGSAAIASHMQNDLCKAVGLRAIVFNESPLLTAYANDHGYEVAFERMVQLWAESEDVLIAISSSGKSENILRAVRMALSKGCQVITFSGFQPNNPLRKMGDINFYVPAQTYGFVEVAHMALGHYLTDCAMAARQSAGKIL